MPDREKVIKGLECCRKCTKDDLSHSDEPCEECPYLVNGNACSPWELFDDALALLKEQEAKTGKWIQYDEDTNAWECSECGALQIIIDGTPIDNSWFFCPHCGARLEWR